MCKHLTMLAKESTTRYIARCEHGSVHVVWDNLSIRLRPADFVRLAERVCTRTGGLPDQDERRGLGLKMHEIGIQFFPETMPVLRELMCLALMQLGRLAEVPGESKALEGTPDELTGTTWAFSLN